MKNGILIITILIGMILVLKVAALDWPGGSGKVNCADCHIMHNASGGTLTGFSTNNALCLSCHDGSTSGAEVTTHQSLECSACHDSHNANGSNLLHVLTTIQTPTLGTKTVSFLNNTTAPDFADDTLPHTGVCEVCHPSSIGYHNHDGSGSTHHAGENCTEVCHPHNASFSPQGGGCTACHNKEQGLSGTYLAGTKRRPIVGATGDFVNGQMGGHMNGTDPTDFECIVCHREGYLDAGEVKTDALYHNNGGAPYIVDLRDVDSATASFPVRTNPSNWPVTSSPTFNTNKNNLTQFCISCHDSDGATQAYTRATGSGGSASNPFGSSHGSPMNVDGQFGGTFSRHALSINGQKYTANWPTQNSSIRAGAFTNGWDATMTTECGDCHLGQDTAGTPTYYHNGHGSTGLRWLLRDATGKDQAHSGLLTLGCFLCHNPQTYNPSGSATSESRFPEHSKGAHMDATLTSWNMECLNCHGGASPGGIHGTSTPITSDSSYDPYRFTNGASLDGWRKNSSTSRDCSTDPKGGLRTYNVNCSNHNRTFSKGFTTNYADDYP